MRLSWNHAAAGLVFLALASSGCMDAGPGVQDPDSDASPPEMWQLQGPDEAKGLLDARVSNAVLDEEAFHVTLPSEGDYALIPLLFPDLVGETKVVLELVTAFVGSDGRVVSGEGYVTVVGMYATDDRATFGGFGIALTGGQFASLNEGIAAGAMTLDYRRAWNADDVGYTSNRMILVVLYDAPPNATALIIEGRGVAGPTPNAHRDVSELVLALRKMQPVAPNITTSGSGSHWRFLTVNYSPTSGRVPAGSHAMEYKDAFEYEEGVAKASGTRSVSTAIGGNIQFLHSELSFWKVAGAGDWEYWVEASGDRYAGGSWFASQPVVPGGTEVVDEETSTGWFYAGPETIDGYAFAATVGYELEIAGWVYSQVLALPLDLEKAIGKTFVPGPETSRPPNLGGP